MSPWSIPHSSTAAAGSTSGASHSKLAGGSSLNQMSLPVDLTAGHVDPYTTSSLTSTTTSATTVTLPVTDKLETSGSGEYDLFGPSSGWYSPFQSGLDITIESDQEKGRHGSRSVTRPRVKIDAATLQSQSRPTLSPFLPPSSFFESSPRTPRIMPFSQHYRGDSVGSFGSAAGSGSGSGSGTGIGMGLTGNEDWSVRTRSSSIAAPMTPLLESDCVDPMDYFGGSRSASSSRRGSVENNLTESLLSGRARMFASSDSSFGSTRLSQSSAGSGQQSVGASGSMTQPSLLGSSPFLPPHHFSATISSRIQAAAAAAAAHSSASNSPVLGGQRTLELPMAMTNPTAATSGISTSSSGAGSLLSDVGFEPTTTVNPLLSGLPGAAGSTSASASSSSTAFVNPWESNYPYKSSSHTMSDTFLPFGLGSSSLNSSSTNLLDHQFQADQDRQSSLLRLMNGGGGSAGSSIDLGNGGDMDSRIGSQLQQHQRDDNESEAIRRGFLFPNLAHHTGVGSTSSLPLLSADLSAGSTGGYHPFASVEMSLAAAANQPPPPMQEEPMYDFVELSIPDLSRKRGGGAGLDGLSSIGAAGSLSGAGGLNSSSSSSLTGIGSFRGAGGVSGGAEGGEKKHRERGARHGRSRSGHHKSASLGSFFPPIPPATTTSSSSSSSAGAASGVGGGDHHHGSPGIQGNSAGGSGPEAPLQSGRHHNHGHSKLGRGSSGGGKDGESRRSRASTGVEQQDIGGGGSHSRGTSRHFDGSNGNSRAKRAPKKDHQQHHQQQSNSHQTQNQYQNQNQNQQQSGVQN